jgi:predicted site-specific integrase-resolvase
MDEFMQAREVAKRLGIKTDTLKKMRRQGRGPRGWKKSGKTVVLGRPRFSWTLKRRR